MSDVVAHDTGYAPERWAFDDEVTRVFDDMLRRSIPQLDVMRGLVTDTAAAFLRSNGVVLDIGCSRGESLAPLVERFGRGNRYMGIDVSEPMLDAARARFSSYLGDGTVLIQNQDVRVQLPDVHPSVTLAVLSILFVPVNHRMRIIDDVYRGLIPGGAFIMVEKLLGSDAVLDALQVDRYHRFKAENGYTAEEIERKRLALEGVQVPLTVAANMDLLHGAGFRHVDMIWRWMNFGAFVAVK